LYRKDLLEKYKKRVPLTWDELENTTLYIIEKEKENGNKELEGFAGQFKCKKKKKKKKKKKRV